MAKKADVAAAKQRKQKFIVAIGGVLLLAVLAIQGPKLLKHGGSSSAKSATATTTTAAGTTTITATSTSSTGTAVPAVAIANGPSVVVAGVALRTAGTPRAQTGQLWSLSRFAVKDPFVQQVKQTTQGGSTASSGGSTTKPAGGAPTATGGGTVTPTTSTPAPFAYATLLVNGQPQQLQMKSFFPKRPLFVLLGVGKDFVKIGVAGGTFTGGQAVKLQLGQPVTLMNTATGERFVMKLVYTGGQPEHIAGFAPPKTPLAATQPTSKTTP